MGVRWRTIAWAAVDRIEKQRIYVGGQFGTVVYVDIIGRSKRLRFDGSIRNYDRLIEIVNRHIRELAVPVFFHDRGYDTVLAAKANVDRKDWRRLNREGVITKVPNL